MREEIDEKELRLKALALREFKGKLLESRSLELEREAHIFQL